MRPFPVFVLLFAGTLFLIAPPSEPQAEQPTLAPCLCAQGGECTCVDCKCEPIPKPVVSVVKPAVRTVEPAKNDPLGYGMPKTAAPVPDELRPVSDVKPSLTPTEAATAAKLYEANHGPLVSGAKAAVRAPAKVAAAAVRAPIKLVRVFAGNVCSGGSCGPSYRWVERVEHPEYGGYYERMNGQWVWQRYSQPQYAAPVESYQPMRRGLLRRW